MQYPSVEPPLGTAAIASFPFATLACPNLDTNQISTLQALDQDEWLPLAMLCSRPLHINHPKDPIH